jgi:fumarate reductase flavoprotein subunit
MMHLAFVDMGLAPEELAARLLAKRPEDIDEALLATVAHRSRETLDWLVDKADARFIKAGAEPWQRWCLAPIRPRRSGLAWTGRGPDRVLRGLERHLQSRNGRLLRGRRVCGLRPKVGGGFEVDVECGGETMLWHGRSVILADGGFQNSSGLVGATLAPEPERTLRRNAGTANGLSMQLAETLGLRTSALHRFYGHIVSAGALGDARLWPWPTLDELAMAGMLLDETGRDVGEGLASGVAMANRVAAGAGRNRFFVVIDDRIWRDIGPHTRVVPCNPFLATLNAPAHRSRDLLVAAAEAGIDPAGLSQSIMARNQKSPAERGTRRPLYEPPFHILPAIAGITYTMSGVEIGTDCTVFDNAHHPVPGLYAAGATAGGLEGGAETFYLGGLAKAAILGRIAGSAACRFINRVL